MRNSGLKSKSEARHLLPPLYKLLVHHTIHAFLTKTIQQEDQEGSRGHYEGGYSSSPSNKSKQGEDEDIFEKS